MSFLKSRVFRLIASLGLASLFYFLCPPCFNKTYLLVVLVLLVIILNLDKYIVKAKILTHITRIAVGGLFIFSGFIKANDPAGFSYKLTEYFEVFGQGFSCDMKVAESTGAACPCTPDAPVAPIVQVEVIVNVPADAYVDTNGDSLIDADDSTAIYAKYEQEARAALPPPVVPEKPETLLKPVWDFFAEHSLFLAIFVCGIEILLGIFLLIGFQTRLTLWLFLGMIVFFSFLTFYSACCNKVTSCGCFGDAIPLTPWESFWKDLILLILVALLFAGKDNIQPISRNSILMAALVGIAGFASFAFPVYTYRHLPVIDFRPYAIGTNIYEATHEKDPAKTGCVRDSMSMEFYYKNVKTNEIKMFDVDHLPEDTVWGWYCRYDKLVSKGNCAATILDFNITDPESGANWNDSLLQKKGIQFFLVMYDISLADREVMGQVNLFYDAAAKARTPFNALASITPEQSILFRTETGARYPLLVVDQTALKTVIRSNPGLMMLKDGVVLAMWHANDFPVYSEVIQHYGSK